jgi:cation-transporting ATPase E
MFTRSAAAVPEATDPFPADPATGLTDAEVDDRRRRGQTNAVPLQASRSVAAILRSNLLTRFNAILGALLVVIVVVGPFQDALFGVVLVTNAAIGVIQEWRAKRHLDRLAVLAAPRATVRRAGRAPAQIPVADLVLDDVIELSPGDQLAVDADVLAGDGLEVDESLLTGESDPVPKWPGDRLLSGSFVAAGTGLCRATHVGVDSYAARLAAEARRFTLVHSQLRAGIDRILRWVTWAIVPTATLLVVRQLSAHDTLADALRGTVAGVGSMVPEGLVLLTSMAFALGVIRLSRHRTLVQELPAIEGLARVDVVCIDKTGTLTEGGITLHRVELLAGNDAEDALGALAHTDPSPNASLHAVAEAFARPDGWHRSATVPFSSARKWSAATFGERGTWVLGAPEMVVDDVPPGARAHIDAGRRVLLLARAPHPIDDATLPRDELVPAALVVLEERVRDDARDTLAWLAREGVTLKVLSGDHPATVGAIARRVGVPGADAPVDARTDTDVLAHNVFGRVTPQQKRDMVKRLQQNGHVVAVIGDGVNDVLALKDADVGVAMGAGSGATRAVAQLVLLDDRFASVPAVIGEGRRVIANVERVANLFLTKTVYAFLLALAIGVAGLPFPFFPRHLTIVSSLTIGIPAFFLALARNEERAHEDFVARVLRFAGPAGFVAATATFGAYAVASRHARTSLAVDRTTATIVLLAVGLEVLVFLARPLTRTRRLLVTSMAGAFVAVLVVPQLRTFFALSLPGWEVLVASVAVALAAPVLLVAGWRITGWDLRPWWPDTGGADDRNRAATERR